MLNGQNTMNVDRNTYVCDDGESIGALNCLDCSRYEDCFGVINGDEFEDNQTTNI